MLLRHDFIEDLRRDRPKLIHEDRNILHDLLNELLVLSLRRE
jgi:hypothetical protein